MKYCHFFLRNGNSIEIGMFENPKNDNLGTLNIIYTAKSLNFEQ